METPTVGIILLNWNNYSYTKECIDSLRNCTYPTLQIIVVDNASTDDSLMHLRAEKSIHLIENQSNLGFAGGNNVGIAHGVDQGLDYIMLLNNDTIVESDFLEPLINVLESKTHIGAVQPKIMFAHQRNTIWDAGGYYWPHLGRTVTRGNGQEDQGQFDTSTSVDWITGCCILVRREIIEQIGMLDPKFFIYYEDVDWSFRMRQIGARLQYIPDSKIYHVAGVTGKQQKKGKEGYLSPRIHYLTIRNNMFIIRNYNKGVSRATGMFSHFLRFVMYVLYFTIRGRFSKLRAAAQGFYDGLRS